MLQIEQTADGSYTLFVPEINEHYHSVKGALTESEHIFINMGLKHSSVLSPRILEIGFGTGLNAFLTLIEAEKEQKKIHYTTIERYPITNDLAGKLTYPDLICPRKAKEFAELHRVDWNTDIIITPYFTINKIKADFTCYPFKKGYDIIYFDAFAPEKQPEMWSQELFDKLYGCLNEKGILTTYCAKGSVRRMLQHSGFLVERLPGPPGGKREILRATK